MLRDARTDAGWSQKQAGQALTPPVSHAVISYMESGEGPLDPLKIRGLLTAYGRDKAHIERVARLAERYADQGAWWADYKDVVEDWLETFLGLEVLAKRLFVWEPMVLPGILQIPEYHEALLLNHLRFAPAEVPHLVKLRGERRDRRLLGQDPLEFTTVIEERTLDRMVGGRAVMEKQYRQLLEWNRLPNVHMYVMPDATAVHDGLDGEFTLLDFEEAQSVAYIEAQDGAMYIQDQDRVGKYDLARRRMCAAATTPVEEAITMRLDRLAAA
ncbi:hypothetical protein SUDANB95_07898 (plasmid) [Actinosynnema sp. ALI-1.44]